MSKTIRLRGPGLNDYFAEKMVEDYGSVEALNKTSGPMYEAVKAVIERQNQAAIAASKKESGDE